jgi:hypothetical protein
MMAAPGQYVYTGRQQPYEVEVAVYHVFSVCPEAQKIEVGDRVISAASEDPPLGRRACTTCTRLAKDWIRQE